MRRVLLFAGVIVATIVLEQTVLGGARAGGARPDLLVVAVVAVAMSAGPVSGAAFGFWAGLVADLLGSLPVGVSALVYTLVGYGVGLVRVYVTSPRAWVHVALAGAASLCSVWLTGIVLRVLNLSSWGQVGRTGVLVAGMNLLLTPFVYPLVRLGAERVQAEKIYRW
jgi:rod shape-determining protein MreD